MCVLQESSRLTTTTTRPPGDFADKSFERVTSFRTCLIYIYTHRRGIYILISSQLRQASPMRTYVYEGGVCGKQRFFRKLYRINPDRERGGCSYIWVAIKKVLVYRFRMKSLHIAASGRVFFIKLDRFLARVLIFKRPRAGFWFKARFRLEGSALIFSSG